MQTLTSYCEQTTALAFGNVMLCAATAIRCGCLRLAQVFVILVQVL